MPTLDWIGKSAVKDHHKTIPYHLLEKDEKLSIGNTKNMLIQGDNLLALKSLLPYYKNKIKCVYIDPPYNTGNESWIYNDKVNSPTIQRWIDKVVGKPDEDLSMHDKWLCMMYPRLSLLRELMSDDGVIIIHIDEHEQAILHLLMFEIFHKNNHLGTLIWNKKNPKGDSKKISYQHEEIVIFAKNAVHFVEKHDLKRPKEHAQEMIKKAKYFFSKLDQSKIPNDILYITKKYNIPYDWSQKFSKTVTLGDINKEYSIWLKDQNFSAGEKAYSHISEIGRVYRLVSMAWPNKKKAPREYFVPLIHPITKKPCPVPKRGWRYSQKTMNELLQTDQIQFGKDHTTQPNRVYFLNENMNENISSILNYGGSDDMILEKMGIIFPNSKPIVVAKTLLKWFTDNHGLVLDSFAGSGTTAQAVMELNKEDGGDRQFILIEMEHQITKDVIHKRLTRVIDDLCST